MISCDEQVVGHMFAYTIVHELLAKSNSERNLVKKIIDGIVGKCCVTCMTVVCVGMLISCFVEASVSIVSYTFQNILERTYIVACYFGKCV